MGIRGEIFSSRIILPNRTYFFNIKENRMGDIYLNIVESKNRDNGGFERQSVILFAEDLQEFLKGFDESLKVLEKAEREKRRSGGAKRSAAPAERDGERDNDYKSEYGGGRGSSRESGFDGERKSERGGARGSSREGGFGGERKSERSGARGSSREGGFGGERKTGRSGTRGSSREGGFGGERKSERGGSRGSKREDGSRSARKTDKSKKVVVRKRD